MIYKFHTPETGASLEIELFNEENQSKELPDSVNFSIDDETQFVSIDLSKQDVYRLIGALHLLHKEMK